MIATLVNAIAVLAGSTIGLILHGRITERFKIILFQAIGLTTLVIGFKDALLTEDIPVLALSLIFGGLVGEALNIEKRLESGGEILKKIMRFEGDSKFVEGFVYASLLFCTGAMTVVGTLKAGVEGNGEIIYTKSLLDGHAAIFLAGAMGAGVMASSVTVLIFQGTLTLLFMAVGSHLPLYVITEVGAAGGLLIVGISINLLDLGKVRVGNLMPGMVFAGLFVWLKHFI